MKKLIMPLLLAVAVLFQSCEGPEGPQGPVGDELVGTTFDLEGVNFTAANEFQYGLTFADAKLGVDVLESDAVLVYINWGTEDVNGTELNAYRLLPQTAFLDNGILTYNMDRTARDFSIFLDGTVDPAKVDPDYTRNQDFRVVIIPSDFALRTAGQVDYSDYNAVVKAYNIDESKIKVVKAN
ncbi:hypothetical protein MUK70_30600 [Dyadobacter chenwenxiniae]|uniref:Uncharacterized protein n=1 Tax=Dyadobacter chenwenxiniae TaxID=2906456 RepID=A0A9X1PPB0_9BACT|nr:hypothetical protein [Dyadobacter chenwenxiniae]MCF0063674.1 hypothetical protein [Dyadobacter chenwenxiniae]UON83350.1 hypothetical protein MUK70_30600 [Dyadobacter chenwenxiniae]